MACIAQTRSLKVERREESVKMQKLMVQNHLAKCQISHHRRIAAVVTACCLALSGCSSWVMASWLQIQPFTGFNDVAAGSLVHVESAASGQTLALAQQLQLAYAAAQKTIEQTHGASLKSPDVYVCASEACFAKYVMTADSSAEAGLNGSTVMLNAVRLLKNDSGVPIFTHELSHIFWYQHGQRCFPRWWLEGMAVSTSGGGAESVSDAQARQLLRDGQVFQAVLGNGCFNPAQRGNLSWAAYYRQAAMFVGYLRESAPNFAHTLALMRQGESVGPALQTAYRQPVAELWEQWRKREMAMAP